MQVLLSAPALSGFSLDSVRQYAEDKLAALQKYLKDSSNAQIRITIQKDGIFYKVSAELKLSNTVFLQSKNINLFAAIDEVTKLLKRTAGKKKTRPLRH